MDISDTPQFPAVSGRPDGDFARILLSAACDEIALANEIYGRADDIRMRLSEAGGPDLSGRLQADAYGAARDAAGRELQIAQKLRTAFSPEEPQST